MRPFLVPLALSLIAAAPPPETTAWREQAAKISITRDDWGIAHVEGPTDADAVFGMIYAQAEDDFPRIEANYLTALGRTAEAEGEKAIWQDLRARLYVSAPELKADYAASPDWLKRLMNSWAAGLNYYLATHPQVTPRVLKRFEPWMALSFTEGSIGGDIERIDLQQLEQFYGGTSKLAAAPYDPDPRGSNGVAIAPALTKDGRALLLINPHTSFFFRSEQQVTSEQGLNVYGAATWGQFFIYQGFNDKTGWMHTSSSVDNIDEYLETITRTGGSVSYKHGSDEKPVVQKVITVPYKTPNGMATREFTTYRTHHGPIVRELEGKWVAIRLMEEPLKALQQSWGRTKTRNLQEYLKVMELHTNSSNNTLFADAEGNIAYLHSNFVPRRDTTFNWTRPVDGSNPATDWKGVHAVSESPNVINPKSGWAYNTNNFP
jgi:acyl-homoserine-lactone acylase